VARITKIIGSLSTFARDTSKEPFQACSIAKIVDTTLDLYGSNLKERGIELTVQVPEPDIVCFCREAQILQVLINLLSNAVDAVEGLDVKKVWLVAIGKDEAVEISVTDTGRGIPPGLEDKIMQPFFTTKPIGKGPGLGLSVSEGIARAHQGSLYLDRSSTLTRFVLTLPKNTDINPTQEPS
jgi:two-component system, NtrC family, sensor kinase